MLKNAKSNKSATPKDKKPGFIARLKSNLSTRKSGKKVNHARNKKFSKIYITMMFLLLALAIWAVTMLTGLVGATVTHCVIAMVKVFGATFDKIFAYKVVLMALVAGAAITAVLLYKQDKKRTMRKEIYGEEKKKKTEFGWMFQYHPLILGAAFTAGILVLGLVGALLWQGVAITAADFFGIAAKVWAPVVCKVVGVCCLLLCGFFWYRSMKRVWIKEARAIKNAKQI